MSDIDVEEITNMGTQKKNRPLVEKAKAELWKQDKMV